VGTASVFLQSSDVIAHITVVMAPMSLTVVSGSEADSGNFVPGVYILAVGEVDFVTSSVGNIAAQCGS